MSDVAMLRMLVTLACFVQNEALGFTVWALVRGWIFAYSRLFCMGRGCIQRGFPVCRENGRYQVFGLIDKKYEA